jgi:hypothetical protein
MIGIAIAGQYSSSWKTNDYVAYCAEQSGGYVLAVQQFERSLGSNKDALDNYWGPHSSAGLKALQRYYRIDDDGCAGPITWSYMRSSLISRCSPGYYCPGPSHRIFLGYTSQYFHKYASTCEWASYTSNNPVAGPVRQYRYYALDDSLRGYYCKT